jgi:hypothetical protein
VSRYHHVAEVILSDRVKTFFEIGVGPNTMSFVGMLLSESHGEPVFYYGLDIDPPAELFAQLEIASQNNPNFNYVVHKGSAPEWFEGKHLEDVDLTLIDAGAGREEIERTVELVKPFSKVIICAHCVLKGVDETKIGSKFLETQSGDWARLPIIDNMVSEDRTVKQSVACVITPSASYNYSRYLPVIEYAKTFSKEGGPIKCITNIQDPLAVFYLQCMRASGREVEFVTNPDEHETIDVALLNLVSMSGKERLQILTQLEDTVETFFLELPDENPDEVDASEDWRLHPVMMDSGPLPTLRPDLVHVGSSRIPVRSFFSPVINWPGAEVKIQLGTKNCVSNEFIEANLRNNTPRIQHWLAPCKKHDKVAVYCSGGPSLVADHLDEIREHIRQGHYVFCVKHAHDQLIKHGIIPHGCILLDPRNHVQDFISDPHPDITYYVATMVHDTTVTRLLERNAKVVGWVANIHIAEEVVPQLLKRAILVSGGSGACTRGITVLQLLGFQTIHLYGYDQAFDKCPDADARTNAGHKKYVKVVEYGREFWTTLEYMAQVNEMKELKTLVESQKLSSFGLNFHMHGNGMVPWVWEHQQDRTNRFEFEDVLQGLTDDDIATRLPSIPSVPLVTLAKF